MASGDLGKGYVHVLDEVAFGAILRELNTVTDFVKYLCAKEELVRQGTGVLCFGEEDLLALYLRNGRRFPDKPDQLIVGGDLWAGLRRERAYRAKKKADKISYAWDNLIETFCADALQGRLEFGGGLTEVEQAIRTMAREDRFCRRMLGQAFVDFIQTCAQKKLRSRVIESESGVVYVFLVQPRGSPREHRKRELTLRCFVARGVHKNREVVVGIATERPENGKGFSLDLVSLKMPAWTQENQVVMDGIQAELGYFWKPVRTSHSEDEYPN